MTFVRQRTEATSCAWYFTQVYPGGWSISGDFRETREWNRNGPVAMRPHPTGSRFQGLLQDLLRYAARGEPRRFRSPNRVSSLHSPCSTERRRMFLLFTPGGAAIQRPDQFLGRDSVPGAEKYQTCPARLVAWRGGMVRSWGKL